MKIICTNVVIVIVVFIVIVLGVNRSIQSSGTKSADHLQYSDEFKSAKYRKRKIAVVFHGSFLF